MENLGALSLLLSFCLAVYAATASIFGGWKGKPYLVRSAERAALVIWALVTFASGLLVYGLFTGDFRLSYVASYSNKAMPGAFKFAAWWGGQEGSLLFWSWILSTYSVVVVLQNRRKLRTLMPWVNATMMVTLAFFLMLVAFVVSPFQVLAVGKAVTSVADGRGLNPLLQYWAMSIHPPMLYLGFVGMVVPFAFALASLITRQPGDDWIKTTRRWSIVTWLFQSCGVILGAGWAYAVLGWGGYWGWDPVENASILPWLTATAFLHSVMMQEKKGMMKVWNMVLVSATFFLCIFGTFLTRSGIVSSVHAFAQSPIGPYFATFLILGIALTTFLILNRLDYLKSESQMESVVSRESSFLFNNLILVASCFSILWGTLFPVISEAVTGEKVSVDAPFFNRVNIPIGIFLLLLMGAGPLFAWRRTSLDSLRRNFLWPTIAGTVFGIVLVVLGVRHLYAALSLSICLFVAWTIFAEFFKGARAISARSGQNFASALVELTHRNTRRYGGYIVHMAIVFMFIGFSGAAFNKDYTARVGVGDSFEIGHYTLKLSNTANGDNANYSWLRADVEVQRDGEFLGILQPEHRFYKASEQGTSEVAIRRRLNEDLYLNFAGVDDRNTSQVVIQAYVFPLVSWIWIGFAILLGGTLICLVPNKTRTVGGKPPVARTTAQEEYAKVHR